MSGNDLIVREGRDLIEGDDRALVEHDDQALVDNGYQPLPGEQAERDRKAWSAAEISLRREWGNEYDRRIALNLHVLETEFGEGLAEDLLYARLDDGRRLADVPEFSKGLSDLICFAYAAASRGVAGDNLSQRQQTGGADVAWLENRKAAIEAIMRTDFARYQEEFASEYENVLNELVRQGKLRAEPWEDAGE